MKRKRPTPGHPLLRGTLAAIALAACRDTACARGFARYVSTPITPPFEMRWWAVFSVACLAFGAFSVFRGVLKRHWLLSCLLAVCALAAFAMPFFTYGSYTSLRDSAPPAGLGSCHPTFWGFGWRHAGALFVSWNLLGFAIYVLALFLCGGIQMTCRKFRPLVLWAAIAYAAAVVPYAVSGAIIHGWPGNDVQRACRYRLQALGLALCAYADEHGGNLVEGKTTAEVMPLLAPYIDYRYLRLELPIRTCPLGLAKDREPVPYVWDPSYSGVPLADIVADPSFREKPGPFSCPYHGGRGMASRMKLIECAAARQPSNPGGKTNDQM